jgi:uncharacterized protein (TIGR02231 family)
MVPVARVYLSIPLVLASPLMLIAPVVAADIPVSSRIHAVTVHPDAASVVRAADVRTPAGQHVLILSGLTGQLDPASLRVEAHADGPLLVQSVDVRRVAGEVEGAGAGARRLGDARAELAGRRARLEAVDAEIRAIADFARIAAQAAASKGAFDIDAARVAWTAVGEATAAAQTTRAAVMQSIETLQAEIRALEAVDSRPRPQGAPRHQVAISVEAGTAVNARLTVTYRVAGARWTPAYDARLDTAAADGKPSLELVRRAIVTQRTGEDWRDVQLTLSTIRAQGHATAPDMRAWSLNLREPSVVMPLPGVHSRAAPATAEAQALAAPAPDLADSERRRAAEQEADLVASPFATSFTAPGETSVSGDGAGRTIRLQTLLLQPQLAVRVAASLDPRAFLTAQATLTGEAALLPGEVALTRDGSFIGKARIGAVQPGEALELGFGVDERIRVERTPVRRRDNDPAGWNNARVQISDHQTRITNLHRQPMRVVVLDRIPVSENSAITVEPLPTNTGNPDRQPAILPGRDARGVISWSVTLAANETRDWRLGWRVRWPADRELTQGF